MAHLKGVSLAWTIVILIQLVPSVAMAVTSSTFAITAATEYTVTAMYTDISTANITVAPGRYFAH